MRFRLRARLDRRRTYRSRSDERRSVSGSVLRELMRSRSLIAATKSSGATFSRRVPTCWSMSISASANFASETSLSVCSIHVWRGRVWRGPGIDSTGGTCDLCSTGSTFGVTSIGGTAGVTSIGGTAGVCPERWVSAWRRRKRGTGIQTNWGGRVGVQPRSLPDPASLVMADGPDTIAKAIEKLADARSTCVRTMAAPFRM